MRRVMVFIDFENFNIAVMSYYRSIGEPYPRLDYNKVPQDRYNKSHTVSIAIRLMKNTEQDIIQKLDSVPNKAGYIKQLIRADMAKDK